MGSERNSTSEFYNSNGKTGSIQYQEVEITVKIVKYII